MVETHNGESLITTDPVMAKGKLEWFFDYLLEDVELNREYDETLGSVVGVTLGSEFGKIRTKKSELWR